MMIESVGILGTGQMGSGIAQVAAQAGCSVFVHGRSAESGQKMVGQIDRMLKIAVRREGMPAEQAEATKSRIQTVTDLAALAACDLVIETVIEDLEIKRELFRTLDGLAKPETIFASNTSSLSVGAIAEATNRPERFLGLHFFNPVPYMELLEVVRTDKTSDAAYQAAAEWGKRLGKTVITAHDSPGFIVNFLLVPYLLGAARFYERKMATKEDIDIGMKLGCGHPKGPLELLDQIGLDTALKVAESIAAAFPGEPQYEPPQILRDLVAAGKLGKKTGEGFHTYGGKSRA